MRVALSLKKLACRVLLAVALAAIALAAYAPLPLARAGTLLSDIYFNTGDPSYSDYYKYWYQGHLTYNASDQTWLAGDDHFVMVVEGLIKVLVDPGTKVYKQVDGRCYDYDNWEAGTVDEDALYALWYPSGELVMQAENWERPDRLVSGDHATLRFASVPASADTWANVVKRSTEQATIDPSLLTGDSADALDMSSWFKGFVQLAAVNGFEQEGIAPSTMAHAFDGCVRLQSLDLSGLDTSRCASMEGMLAGCELLDTLVLGQGWTQAYARSHYAGQATFPVDMKCVDTQQVFAEGELIPDGPGTYETTRTPLTGATLCLLDPTSGEEVAAPYEYTGLAITPDVQLELAGQTLQRDVDFDVSYKNNTENGTATVTVKGKRHDDGTGYAGVLAATFEIVDTACYANLYANGTLVLQASHVPIPGVAGTDGGTPVLGRWFMLDGTDANNDVPWNNARARVKKVIIDSSFAQFRPTSAEGWFAGCTKLESIEGLQHLNTSALTSMAGMFSGCTSLEKLDLSGLSARGVTDFAGFFDGCTALKRLVGGSWSSEAAPVFPADMFCEAQSWRRYQAGEAIPANVEACTRDITLRRAQVIVDSTSFDCTEKPITLNIEVKLGSTTLVEGTDYTVTYANNVWPGEATATIEASGAFTGGLIVPFTIVDNYVHVGDRLVYRTKDAVFTFKVLEVTNAGGVTVRTTTVLERVEVNNTKLKTLTLPSECTVGGVKVSVTQVGAKLAGKFGNVSCIVIGPKVVVIGAKAFVNAKKVVKLKVKSARLTKVTNCLKGSKVKKVAVKVQLTKKRQKTYKKWFTKKAGKKRVKYSYG